MDIIDKYKIFKKIGSGGQGTTYLVKKNNKKYALKIEKILEKDIKKNLGSIYWREIDFATNMANKYPNFFTKLYDHDIINNCDFILENPHKIEQIDVMNTSPFCSRKIYELIDTTLDKIINKLKLPEIYSVLIQLSYIIYIMNKNGYTHNDLHSLNIGIKNTTQKYITIFDKRIPTFGRFVKLIDYGSVLHKKYDFGRFSKFIDKKNELKELIGFNESKFLSENLIKEIRRILDIIFELSFYSKIPIKFWKKYDYNKDLNNFLNSEDAILVNTLVENNDDKYNLYALLYPEKYQKRLLKSKFKKTINNIMRLPIEDVIFLMNNTHIKTGNDIKKNILYLIQKLEIFSGK